MFGTPATSTTGAKSFAASYGIFAYRLVLIDCVPTVRRRLRDDVGADVAARAWPVIHDELLAQALGELLRDRTGEDVRGAARGEGDDQAHGARRVCLRQGDKRSEREQNGDGGANEQARHGITP